MCVVAVWTATDALAMSCPNEYERKEQIFELEIGGKECNKILVRRCCAYHYKLERRELGSKETAEMQFHFKLHPVKGSFSYFA